MLTHGPRQAHVWLIFDVGRTMETSAKIVGVYPVDEAEEPCHLVEIGLVADKVYAVGEITQEVAGLSRENWQAPYAERLVSAKGDTPITEEFEAESAPELWSGEVRLVFFFHYLDPTKPLITPFGTLSLPPPSDRPVRLSGIRYQAP